MRRLRALGLMVLVIALGLGSRRLRLGFALWDKSLGDALYAVMLYLLVLVVRPSTPARACAAIAFAASFAIELFQLTGIPAAAPRFVQVALGTAFAWHDVVCYAIGSLAAAALHVAWNRRRGADWR